MADLPERPSYFKYAFANAYNLSLLGGALAASAATGDWAIGVIAAGIEALWLSIGADTGPFRRWVERQHRARLLEQARLRRKTRILALPDQRDREKAIDLIEAHKAMGVELDKNANWSTDMVRGEYDRLESLLDAWVDLAEAADRFEGYIRQLDLDRLRRDLAAQEKLAEQPRLDPESRGLALKNADLLRKRVQTLSDMGTLVQRTRGQMAVIENTFRLLRDQITSLKVPQDIHAQIDEIVTNVDAVRSVVAEGDQSFREVAEAPATSEAEQAVQAMRSRTR